MRLIGAHIFENFASILAIADRIGIPMESVRRTFEEFEGLPYRLRYVTTVRGVEFWDDAHSPTPESTIASMTAVVESGRRIETMLLGGLNRGYDYRALGEAVVRYGVRRCVLFPDAGAEIKKYLPDSVEIFETRDMDEAVRWATLGEPGVCLLSAAAPSYSIWKNFEEKGERFIEAIARLPA
jgi:UDP-N-acetylmuramoylalanine-D-glutamate ligase